MGKFMLETALFVGILCQIYLLAAPRGQGMGRDIGQGIKAQSTAPVTTLAEIQDFYVDAAQANLALENDPTSVNHITSPMILQKMAQMEAERILATGDYESLQNRIENNAPILKLMGYNF